MKLGQAQGLLDHGYDLFPIRHDKKIPLYKGWREAPALAAPQAIKYARLGVRMRADQLVIDVDRHEGRPHGDPRGLRLPPAPTVTTAGGGLHIYFRLPEGHGKIRHILPEFPGIEFKTLGRFVVAPCQEGYDWDDLGSPDLPAPVLPDHVLSLITAPSVGIGDVIGMATVEWQPAELAAALDQLDPTEYREHDKWFSLMAACHEATGGAGLEEFTRWSVADGLYAGHEGRIANRWASLVPGKAGNAGMGTLLRELGGERPASAAAREAVGDFDSMPVESTPSAVDNPLAVPPETAMQLLSKDFKVVNDAGRLRVYSLKYDETLGREEWDVSGRQDFVDIVKSAMHIGDVAVGQTTKGTPKFVPAGVAFLDHYKKKITYTGTIFMPECDKERTPEGRLNLWRGFAVKEKKGSWEYLKEVTWETLCDGDMESYEYVMNWLARAVQRPWEPGGTAMVFKGAKGTGKSTLGRSLVRLFGTHGLHVSSKELLTGRFNAHLMNTVALFADEAFWAGDKSGEGVLKALVTERMLTYEAKGRDPRSGRNCLHVMMASNEDWVVPAGIDGERRFAVFEVSGMIQPRTYWDRLHEEMNDGGQAAMLWELRRRDISQFDVFKVPRTQALADQKAHTMSPLVSWLIAAAENDWEDFGEPIEGEWYGCDEVYSSYVRAAERRAVRNPSAFGIALKKYVPGLAKRRVRTGENRQRYYYLMPSSSEVLAKFSDLIA